MTALSADAPYTHDDARWRAVLDRDPAADGAFYYAVRSTGVYCRPTCPSRRPARARVAFYDEPDAAERAGFRACLRCKPGSVSGAQQVVAQVQRLLEEAGRALTLPELA